MLTSVIFFVVLCSLYFHVYIAVTVFFKRLFSYIFVLSLFVQKNVSKVIKQQSEAISSTKSGKRDVPFQDMSLFPVKSGDENDPDKLWYEFRVAGTVDYSMKPFLKISWYKSGWPDYYVSFCV